MREAFRRYLDDFTRQQDLQQLKVAVDALREEARETAAGKLTTRQLEAEIAAGRRQRRQREPVRQPVR
jgi:hypothetical protein